MKLYFRFRIISDYFVGLIISVYFFVASPKISFGLHWPADAERVDFISSIMSVSAALLGLVLAASTFLVGHIQNQRFEILRNSQGWREFPNLVKSCLWRLLILTLFCGICSLSEFEFFKQISPILVFLVVICTVSFSALVWVMSAIIAIQD